MFSLIITIISIALVAALAVATIYYGGSAFTQGSAKAAAASIVAQAQQIAAASTLYENDNAKIPNAVGDLVGTTVTTQYLAAVPTASGTAGGGSYTIAQAGAGFSITLTGVPANVCNAPTATNGTQYYCNATGLVSGAAVSGTGTGTFVFND